MAKKAAYIGAKVSNDLKAKLEALADKNALSLSMEIQLRLEQSLRDDVIVESLAAVMERPITFWCNGFNLVGEQGPELFISDRDGQVIPNPQN